MKVFGGRNENLKNPQKMKLQQRPGPGGCHNDGETGEVTGTEVSPNWLVRWSAGPRRAAPRRVLSLSSAV